MPIVRVKHESHIAQYCREKGLNLKTSMPAVLHQAGRLCAVSAAFQAQPFGIDEKAQALGVVATTRDIYRVYATPGKAYDDISDDGAKAGFWKAVKTSAWDRAAKILNREGSRLKGTLIDNFDGGAQHRQLRNNQGRIPASQKPVMVVKDAQKLKSYVLTETKKVGFGKGGWAACARALGGTRGIPGWISRQNAPGTVIENYGATVMSITMTNQVPYASAILSSAQKQEAVRIAMDKLRASIQIALQHTGKAPALNA
jgi:hypothetical protein